MPFGIGCCCNSSTCNAGLAVAIYGCQYYDSSYNVHYTDLGSAGSLTVTDPNNKTYTGSGSQANVLKVPFSTEGNYTIQASGTGYFSGSYTFNWTGDCNNYSVGIVLTPTTQQIYGTKCNYTGGGVAVTVSGAWSGSGTSTGSSNTTISVSGPVSAGQSYTVTYSADRYTTQTFNLQTVAPTASQYFLVSGGTLNCSPLGAHLQPQSCYTCWQDCELPAYIYSTIETPIGSVVLPTIGTGSGTAVIDYTTSAYSSCCGGTLGNYNIPFTVHNTGEIDYHTCANVETGNNQVTCGPVPAVITQNCTVGASGSNFGYQPNSPSANCVSDQQYFCPPGKLESFQVSGTGFLDGTYTITEYGCSSYYGGNMQMAHESVPVKETYYVHPVKTEVSSKRSKWDR